MGVWATEAGMEGRKWIVVSSLHILLSRITRYSTITYHHQLLKAGKVSIKVSECNAYLIWKLIKDEKYRYLGMGV